MNVAEPNEAGTPPAAAPVSENAGTGVQAPQDGSESQGKPIDAGLLEAWKPKVEGYNAAMQRAAELEARLAAIERERYSQQPNPLAQTVQNLAERAQYGDQDAAAVLQVMQLTAAQQAENNLLAEMVRSDVPKKYWDNAAALVRQSGYRMGFANAAQLAQGVEAPVLNEQLRQKDEELARLRAQLDGRTVGNGQPKVSLSTPSAPVGDSGALEMDADEYSAIMRRGGPEALALRDRGVKFKLRG